MSETPAWFTITHTRYGYLDGWEVRVHDISSLPRWASSRRRSRWAETRMFDTKAEAIAYGEDQGWVLVKSWNEARELATPYFVARDAADEKRREFDNATKVARAGMIEVRIGDERRWVTPGYAKELFVQVSANTDEFGVKL